MPRCWTAASTSPCIPPRTCPRAFPEGIDIAGYLPREDVRDAFIGARRQDPDDLPHGAVVGTASLRRQALIRRLRPDITTTLLRGNVETRLRKIAEGELDATLLASPA